MPAKRIKICKGSPIALAAIQYDAPTVQQEFQQQEAAASLGVGPSSIAASQPSLPTAIPVSIEVSHCQLAHSSHLRVVGSCPALGAWQVGAAPALECQHGHRWAGTLALPPGRHAFKLVVVGADGSTAWEAGADRALRIPELAAAPAGAPPLLAVTCARFGGTEETTLEVDHTRLQAVADAAAARVADLARRKAELAAKLAGLEAEVVEREARIARTAADARHALDDDLTRQHAERRQRAQRMEVAAAAAELRSMAGALCAPAAQLAAAASGAISGATAASAEGLATVLAGSDGSLQFSFAGGPAGQGSRAEPTALELARSRLTSQLPAAAAAALERRLGGSGASHGRRYADASTAGASSAAVGAPPMTSAAGPAAMGLSSGAAGGGVAAPKNQHLARQVNQLRQEVAAGAKHISDLSEQLDMLLTLGGRRRAGGAARGGARGARASSAATGSGTQRTALGSAAAQKQGLHVGAQPVAAKAGHAVAAAAASKDAPKQPPGAAAKQGSIGHSLAGLAAAAVPKAEAARVPAPATSPAEPFLCDAFTRPSFPIAAAVVAAEAIVCAGSAIWNWGGWGMPRPARFAAGAAFWVGCGLAVLPLVY